jgi:hypothetical protein
VGEKGKEGPSLSNKQIAAIAADFARRPSLNSDFQ